MVFLIIGALVSSARLLALPPGAEKRMTRPKILIPRRSNRYPASAV